METATAVRPVGWSLAYQLVKKPQRQNAPQVFKVRAEEPYSHAVEEPHATNPAPASSRTDGRVNQNLKTWWLKKPYPETSNHGNQEICFNRAKLNQASTTHRNVARDDFARSVEDSLRKARLQKSQLPLHS